VSLPHVGRTSTMTAMWCCSRFAEELLGVARFFADPDNRATEFAIAVRSDWKGAGSATG
jgi:hypothetical protein